MIAKFLGRPLPAGAAAVCAGGDADAATPHRVPPMPLHGMLLAFAPGRGAAALLAILGVLAACRDASSKPKPKPSSKPTASAETAADVELPMVGEGLHTTMPATWMPELSAQPGIEGFPVALGDRVEDAVRRLPAETRAADVVQVGVELSYGTPARVEAIELARVQERGTWLRDRLKQRWGAPAVMPVPAPGAKTKAAMELRWLWWHAAGRVRARWEEAVVEMEGLPRTRHLQLAVERYVTLDDVVGAGRDDRLAIERVPLLGATRAAIQEAYPEVAALGLASQEAQEKATLVWPQLAHGEGDTSLSLRFDGSGGQARVIAASLDLDVELDPARGADVLRAFASRFGEPSAATADPGAARTFAARCDIVLQALPGLYDGPVGSRWRLTLDPTRCQQPEPAPSPAR